MGVPRNVTTTYAEFDRFWNEVLGDAWCLEDDDLPDGVYVFSHSYACIIRPPHG